MLCEGTGTCLKLRPIFSALAIASEGIAIIPMVAIALGLPARQPVHVYICCTEAPSNVALPALADYLHFEIVDWERGGTKTLARTLAASLSALPGPADAARRGRWAQPEGDMPDMAFRKVGCQ